MPKPIYVIGTNLSHNGSTCLMKDGQILVAIEKERLTRLKHDGGNDRLSMQYCLDVAGITMNDVALIVQNANFGMFKFGSTHYKGERLINKNMSDRVISISHHLAHAYSVIGSCPFDEFNVLVCDGCGSQYDDCIDLLPDSRKFVVENHEHLYAEKDSYYRYSNGNAETIFKDFSEFGYEEKMYPMHPNSTKHSIGGIYAAASKYCLGGTDDVGKLMGLSPYGRKGVYSDPIFDFQDGRVLVNYDWMYNFKTPVRSYNQFKQQFQYYADIAFWVQDELEKAIIYMVENRVKRNFVGALGYAGGVALNAVANHALYKQTELENIYWQPAAGDNGVALGCAYYGWLEVLQRERALNNQSTCLGKSYSNREISLAIEDSGKINKRMKSIFDGFFTLLPLYFEPLEEQEYGKDLWIRFEIDGVGQYIVHFSRTEVSVLQRNLNVSLPLIRFKPVSFHKSMYEIGSLSCKEQVQETLLKHSESYSKQLDSISRFCNQIRLQDLSKLLMNIELEHNLVANSPVYYDSSDLIDATAKLILDGNVVGWFQNHSEFGPRALGHRSILADPRIPGIADYINAKIKLREDYRPFAPSILVEEAHKYFKYKYESPYMIVVNEILDEWREEFESVIHIDGTSRVQTVRREDHPIYYRLLEKCMELDGLPMLLNTSFNRRKMPIVETPHDALNFFYECNLDYLVLGNYIIANTGKELPAKNKLTNSSTK